MDIPRYAHLGLYGYRRQTLLTLASLPPPPLESCERLEQLRALAHGIRIRCRVTSFTSIDVDTPEDLLRAEALWQPHRIALERRRAPRSDHGDDIGPGRRCAYACAHARTVAAFWRSLSDC